MAPTTPQSIATDKPKFRHVRVRSEDLKGPADCKYQTDPESRRLNVLTAIDVIVDASLQAWADAKSLCTNTNSSDIPMFMEHWRELKATDPRSAVVALSEAAYATKQALLQPSISIILDESNGALYDVLSANTNAGSNRRWPQLSHIVPELCHWLLALEAPDNERNLQILMEELLQSTFSSPYAMLGLHGQLCEGGFLTKIEAKPALYIGDRKLITHQATHGALRVLGLSTFVSTLWKSVLSQGTKQCSSCHTVRSPHHLKRCARCHCTCYCNRVCQKQHFVTEHQMDCNEWKEIYERYEGNPLKKTSESVKMSVVSNLEHFVHPKLVEDSKVLYPLKVCLRDDVIRAKEEQASVSFPRS